MVGLRCLVSLNGKYIYDYNLEALFLLFLYCEQEHEKVIKMDAPRNDREDVDGMPSDHFFCFQGKHDCMTITMYPLLSDC